MMLLTTTPRVPLVAPLAVPPRVHLRRLPRAASKKGGRSWRILSGEDIGLMMRVRSDDDDDDGEDDDDGY